jgi:hypothetical protein
LSLVKDRLWKDGLASPYPERALAAADRLRDLQPGLAHNVHMPSHIDVRIGHWYEAITTNLKAVEADRRYRKVFGEPKGLIVLYAARNQHMLAYAAMMTGQRDLAVKHIRAMVKGMPEEVVKEYATLAEAFAAVPYEVFVRFGMWGEILAEPDHPEFMVFTRGLRHAARGIAYAAMTSSRSRTEQVAYLEASKLVPAHRQRQRARTMPWLSRLGQFRGRSISLNIIVQFVQRRLSLKSKRN